MLAAVDNDVPELTRALLRQAASIGEGDEDEPLEPLEPHGDTWLSPAAPPGAHATTPSITQLLGLDAGSMRACVYNLFSSVLGAGVLGLPYAARTYGFFGGLLLIVPFACASLYTLRLLQWSANIVGVRGYRELCAVTLALRWRWTLPLISVTIFCNTFGSLVVYLIVLGDLVSQFASSRGAAVAPPPASWLVRPALVIVVLGCFLLLPLSLVKDLTRLRYTSFLSVTSILYLAGLLGVRCVQAAVADGGEAAAEAARMRPAREVPVLLGGLPTFIYAFSCHFNFFAAIAGLRRSSERLIVRVQVASIGLSLFVYVAVVGAVLLLYGTGTRADFLLNLDETDVAFDVAKGAYMLVLIAAYPLNCHPCARALLEGIRTPGAAATAELLRAATTAAVVGLSIVLAIYCPDISVALSLVGGTATASILYILPALFFLDLTAPGADERRSPIQLPPSPLSERRTWSESDVAARRPPKPLRGASAALRVKVRRRNSMPADAATRGGAPLACIGAHRAACRVMVLLGVLAWVCSLVGLLR